MSFHGGGSPPSAGPRFSVTGTGGKLYRRKARRVILLITRLRNPRDLRVGLSITKQVGLGCTNGASSSKRSAPARTRTEDVYPHPRYSLLAEPERVNLHIGLYSAAFVPS